MNIKGFTLPGCEIRGCELTAQFHGFGHDYCWGHYSAWMVRFPLTDCRDYDRNPPLTITAKSAGHDGQMGIQWEEQSKGV
jgi:hypothetical protein